MNAQKSGLKRTKVWWTHESLDIGCWGWSGYWHFPFRMVLTCLLLFGTSTWFALSLQNANVCIFYLFTASFLHRRHLNNKLYQWFWKNSFIYPVKYCNISNTIKEYKQNFERILAPEENITLFWSHLLTSLFPKAPKLSVAQFLC